jgi:uncharacterized protein (DUF2336 family)
MCVIAFCNRVKVMMKLPAYPTLDGLVDLACRDGVDIRPTLIRVLTDLYVQKSSHSADEETQYVELALGLLDTIDNATRAAVAASLSKYPAAPRAILEKLGAAQPAARAEPVPTPAPETADLTDLFFSTGVHGRRQILANLEIEPAALAHRPTPASSEVVRRLEAAALQHNSGEFGRILERALGISRALAERIVRDASGEPVAIVAKALGMKAAVLQRVLLFLNPEIGQSVERVHDLAILFDALKPEAAEYMVSVWRTSDQKPGHAPRRVYETMHYDDERRGARPQSAPAARRNLPSRNDQPARNRDSGR